ncbi:MAG: radical SAM family heme chaperone HemW [Phycisphaerae bacterium]|nr:radical SAM family heme chaperone HemW [Phycisphaerae bacterium]
MTTPAPCRSLYVHVPFCRSRCGYCDFYSRVLDPAAVTPLVDALLHELAYYAAERPFCFDTIYVGGGTPTVLPPSELERLLRGLRRYAAPRNELEFTVEANPATVPEGVAAVLAAAGVQRVSIGAQSFNATELRVLERTHQPAQVAETVMTCRRAGIRQVNLDLIFGIPEQTPRSWLQSLQAALALEPEHLSCYGLTYEPGTPLRRRLEAGLVRRVDHDLEAEMYELTLETLPAAGLPQYEISNFARPGSECRHNLRYWHNEPYLGLGPSAAGFIDEVRYKNVADTAAYVQAVNEGRSPWSEQEQLPPERRVRESAMLALRLTAGLERRRFQERYGTDPAELFAAAVERHVKTGLLEADDAGLRLTRAGLLVADTVMADFLSVPTQL